MSGWISRTTRLTLLAMFCFHSTAVFAEEGGLSARMFDYHLRHAEAGDMNSQLQVAERYEQGQGVTRNPGEALRWYRAAAEKGNAQAQYKVGKALLTGRGAAVDAKAAKSWLEKAAAQGYAPAKTELTDMARTEQEAKAKAEREAKAKLEREAKLKNEREAKAKQEQEAKLKAAAERDAQAKAEREAKLKNERAAKAQVAARESAPPTVQPQATRQTASELRAAVNGAQWTRAGTPVEYLPSPRASCVASGADRLMCFTDRLFTTAGGAVLSYMVKSEAVFKDGAGFDIHYRYQVMKLSADATKAVAVSGTPPRAALGWQEPGIKLHCTYQAAGALDCTDGGKERFELKTR